MPKPDYPTDMQPNEPATQSPSGTAWLLFLGSFLALYFELVIIRYLSAEIRVFAYLKNLPLIASFLGIGLGMVLGGVRPRLYRAFPALALVLFFLIAFANRLHLVHLPMPWGDYFVFHMFKRGSWSPLLLALLYLGVTLGILALVVAFFMVLGGLLGEQLARMQPLQGYSVNLAGSLAGIAVFTLLSVLSLPPVVWTLGGFAAALPFFARSRSALVLLALTVVVSGATLQVHTYWSPYYRIQMVSFPSPPDWPRPAGYQINVNHDFHQRMVDLSPDFVAKYPNFEPNASSLPSYELPYRLVANPGYVLIVGAGTGNDVAAALRHGATHVDAVEIDPMINHLGRKHHPEQPYSSPQVTTYIDDARAFFKKSQNKYDVIIFGYLDSHTLLTSFSSLRLDNYVYTLESFQEARNLLKPNGSMVLAFGSGHGFVSKRLFDTLTQAFGIAPLAYFTGKEGEGVVFVEGYARQTVSIHDFPEISQEFAAQPRGLLATDRWPFLYLARRTIPNSILWVLLLFLIGAYVLVDGSVGLRGLGRREHMHLFLLGAGFLLLETKAVTELSLLFGSTWIVNAVVIGAFLTMALAANALVIKKPMSRVFPYLGLFVCLVLDLVFPFSILDSLPTVLKVLGSGVLVGLPVFFSGLIFSRSFRDVSRPAEGLGFNLVGAVVGGALENAVMIGGIPLLGLMAIAIYAMSAFVLKRSA